mmetsp:Transcript_4414/g.2906  ORF Transcript_4414/g.2906 Transcript_4414/m.2906 type:complete len:171 (-) Transcript_4414:498-1010(-)
MQSKLENAPKIKLQEYKRWSNFKPLFRGSQAVLYGYALSSMAYFYCYAKVKELLRVIFHQEDGMGFLVTFLTAIIAAAGSEIVALPLYYPFDLIKTRMQTSNHLYKYNNLLDAFFKIYQDKLPVRKAFNFSNASRLMFRLSRYYSGMWYYGLTMVSFVAIEFALYESVIE